MDKSLDPFALTRRQILPAAGFALSGLFMPPLVQAQTAAPLRVLEAKKGRLNLTGKAGEDFEIWGFDGQSPGPILRLRKGEEVRLRVLNSLEQAMAVHWGGVRNKNAMDGVEGLTQKPIAAGQFFDYRFTPPDAGTFWYHASSLNSMPEQVGVGLLIVEEPEPIPIDQEMIALVQDWQVGGDFKLQPCRLADVPALVSVNGKLAPEAMETSPAARVRLRIANLAAQRSINLTFEDLKASIIAIDGQACTAFEPVRRTIPLGPGARFDLILDMPKDMKSTPRIVMRDPLNPNVTETSPLINFVLKGEAKPDRGWVEDPKLNPLLPGGIRLERARRLDFIIDDGGANLIDDPLANACLPKSRGLWRVNGKSADALGKSADALNDQPLFRVPWGSAVQINFINTSRLAQVMRVHGHVVRQLHNLDDGWEPYWRDSVIIPPGQTVRIAFVADNRGKWRLGSGRFSPDLIGLSSWFEVT